jgi:hypothetical protein
MKLCFIYIVPIIIIHFVALYTIIQYFKFIVLQEYSRLTLQLQHKSAMKSKLKLSILSINDYDTVITDIRRSNNVILY